MMLGWFRWLVGVPIALIRLRSLSSSRLSRSSLTSRLVLLLGVYPASAFVRVPRLLRVFYGSLYACSAIRLRLGVAFVSLVVFCSFRRFVSLVGSSACSRCVCGALHLCVCVGGVPCWAYVSAIAALCAWSPQLSMSYHWWSPCWPPLSGIRAWGSSCALCVAPRALVSDLLCLLCAMWAPLAAPWVSRWGPFCSVSLSWCSVALIALCLALLVSWALCPVSLCPVSVALVSWGPRPLGPQPYVPVS